MEPWVDKEHDDPVLLPHLVGVLSDPENHSLLQELGERSGPPQNCSLVYFIYLGTLKLNLFLATALTL